jgi:hypothetical protein
VTTALNIVNELQTNNSFLSNYSIAARNVNCVSQNALGSITYQMTSSVSYLSQICQASYTLENYAFIFYLQ